MLTKITLILIVLIIALAGCNPASQNGQDAALPPDEAQGDSSETSADSNSTSNKQLLPLISGKDMSILLDENADGTTQELKVGDVIAITLESNPSTGYGWFAKSSNADVLDQSGEAQYQEPTSSSDEFLLGAPGTETLYFEAASKGTTLVTLEYKRNWETDVAPEKVITFTVEVK